MREQRLFHRYPTGLKVGFRTGKQSYRGVLANVSAGGGYIVTDARPKLGARVQMAARRDSEERSIWLDLRVAWTVYSADESGLQPGFGGFWLHASSRHSEERLRVFLEDVLGITRAVIRPMNPPTGGKTVYVYKFPDVYQQNVFDDLPWLNDGNAGATEYAHGRSRTQVLPVEGQEPEVLQSDSETGPLSAIPSVSVDGPERLATNEAAFERDDSEDGSTSQSEERPGDSDGGRWDFLVKRLSGIRSRNESEAKKLTRIDATQVACQYRIGRRAFDAKLRKCGSDWVVFEPSDRLPEVWSRIVITFYYATERRGPHSDVHATVTRLKETSDGNLVHCKVNQVDEAANPGAYHRFVKEFNRQ